MRVIRDMGRKIQGNNIFTGDLLKAFTLQKQQRHSEEKVYLWHAPKTQCIDKGEALRPYEFACKVSVTVDANPAHGGQFVLRISALHQNPCDGYALVPVLKSFARQTGITAERIYVDKCYQWCDYENKYRIFKSGQKRSVKGTIKEN